MNRPNQTPTHTPPQPPKPPKETAPASQKTTTRNRPLAAAALAAGLLASSVLAAPAQAAPQMNLPGTTRQPTRCRGCGGLAAG